MIPGYSATYIENTGYTVTDNSVAADAVAGLPVPVMTGTMNAGSKLRSSSDLAYTATMLIHEIDGYFFAAWLLMGALCCVFLSTIYRPAYFRRWGLLTLIGGPISFTWTCFEWAAYTSDRHLIESPLDVHKEALRNSRFVILSESDHV